MPFIYENDISKTNANLQTTVAYLVSLHKNEYEWNMLGIKMVGHIDKLPIPDGQYEYGDAYMVGTETPYEMYVYTRADAMHSTDYWFNIGKFPQPGPQGPAGSGLSDVTELDISGVDLAEYDTDIGARITYGGAALIATDPNTHEQIVDDIPTTSIQLPIKPGKYINIDANSSNTAIEVKVDDTELANDYVKLPTQTGTRVPLWLGDSQQLTWQLADSSATNSTVMLRDSNANAKVHNLYCDEILRASDGYQAGTVNQLRYAVTTNADYTVAKTSTDTGTIAADKLANLQQFTQMHIVYDNQLYYRMDPLGAPDGTLNYIHIDSVQDGSGGYKATGKCFSITTATRAWQVVDLIMGGGSGSSYINTVNLTSSGNVRLSFTLTTSTPLTQNNLYARLAAIPIIGIYYNLATSESAFEPAQITLPNVGATNISVITGAGKQYTYTTNQMTISILSVVA